MNKKLPNVFANPISKKLSNVQEFFYGSDREEKTTRNSKSVEQKINDIFSSRDFVYKRRVVIETKDGSKTCVLVGKTDKSLLTMDNETIPIHDVLDIQGI